MPPPFSFSFPSYLVEIKVLVVVIVLKIRSGRLVRLRIGHLSGMVLKKKTQLYFKGNQRHLNRSVNSIELVKK